MRGGIPRRPTGFDDEAIFYQAVWDKLWGTRSRISSSSTVKVDSTTRGITLRAEPQGQTRTILHTPLDQAVYADSVLAGKRIFAVRGGFVFAFDDSGFFVKSKRYITPTFSESSVAYDSISDRVYTILWNDPDGGKAKGIQKIHPVTLSVESFIDLTALGFTPNTDSNLARMICRNGILYGITGINSNGIFRYNIAGSSMIATYAVAGDWQSVEVNGLELWATDSLFGQSFAYDSSNLNFLSAIFPGSATWDLCVRSVNGRGYFTTRSETIKRVASNRIVLSDLTLPDVNAEPFCIRYDQYEDLIYVPDETTNKVFVIDPNDMESITEKTGFDSPFDAVPTPGGTFIVQRGKEGLKLVN